LNTLVLEEHGNHEIAVNVYQKLANNRILFIDSYVNDKIAADITSTLLLRDIEDPINKISIFINAYGGSLRSIFMIYDMMKIVRAPIETICMGAAFNEIVLLLAAGSPGMRYATPNAMISPSQLYYGGSQYSDLTDAEITMSQIKLDNKKFIEALSKNIRKPVKQIMKDLDRKQYFTPKQSKDYGIIDEIVKIKK
jgi:ATP-dependent Clp protease protease subunit